MPLLVIAAVVLGIWYVMQRRKSAKAAEAAKKAGAGLRWIRKGLLAVVGVAVFVALIQGCEAEEAGDDEPRREPCTSFHEEDCPPGGVAPLTSTTVDGGDEPRRLPCPAFDAEDCPLAPPEPPPVAEPDDAGGVARQLCPAYDIEDCPPA